MRKQAGDNSVEVIIVDDPWAEFGTPLPHQLPQRHNKNPSPAFKRWGVWSAAALLTVIVHGFLLGPLLLSTSGRKPHPPLTEGAAASAQNADASEFVSTLILLSDRSITQRETQDDSAFAALKQAEQASPSAELAKASNVPQLEVSGAEDGKDTNAPTAEASGDEAGRAMLFGRYMGQIKARIERAWVQPATSSRGKFHCKVQIKQTQQGEVQEVTLQRCDDDSTWQVSLVHAIQSASPLSAPPNEKVFSTVITLSFDTDSVALAGDSR